MQPNLVSVVVSGFGGKVGCDHGLVCVGVPCVVIIEVMVFECMKPHAGMTITFQRVLVVANDVVFDHVEISIV